MPAVRGLELQNDEAVQGMLKGVDLAATRPEPAWREFAQYMRVVTDRTFARLRHGGSYRGVTWKGFAPQYTRKDGTVVPAWGGIPRVDGRGLVLGRKRPSGQRLKEGDSLMQDTGAMRGRAALVMRVTGTLLEMGPQGMAYAAEQDRRRPFLFFEVRKDLPVLVKILAKHIQTHAKAKSTAGLRAR